MAPHDLHGQLSCSRLSYPSPTRSVRFDDSQGVFRINQIHNNLPVGLRLESRFKAMCVQLEHVTNHNCCEQRQDAVDVWNSAM